MKLIELHENTKEIISDADIQMLRKDCKAFFNTGVDGFFIRGIKGSTGNSILRKTVRPDRTPRNSSAEMHDAFDDWFLKNFGYRARSESLFVFPDGEYELAYGYGPVHAIFPIGDFDFLWAPGLEDLYSYFHRDFKPDELDHDLKSLEFQTTDLLGALESDGEIMLKCKEYYAVPVRSHNAVFALRDRIFPE